MSIIQLGTPKPAYYKDILMRANPSLHEEAFAVLQKNMPSGTNVVDLGAGQGAFSIRMADAGYAVTAVDKNVEDFRAPGVGFLPVNFDFGSEVESFTEQHRNKFDAAIGMEVIEHVENPWDYCRLLLSLVRPGGIVLITTPNIESVHSRVNFLFSGMFEHFSIEDFHGSGHINPLAFHELQIVARGVGAEIVSVQTLCPLPWLIISRRISTIFKSLVSAILRPFMGPNARGDIICMVLRKPAVPASAVSG